MKGKTFQQTAREQLAMRKLKESFQQNVNRKKAATGTRFFSFYLGVITTTATWEIFYDSRLWVGSEQTMNTVARLSRL